MTRNLNLLTFQLFKGCNYKVRDMEKELIVINYNEQLFFDA